MSASLEEVRARNLRTVALLAALFLVPLLLAFFMYYGGSWRPAGHTNNGELILPPRALPQTSAVYQAGTLAHGWSLVYIGDGACNAAGRNALLVMRQTRLALNNDMSRVQRIFFATGTAPDEDFLTREHAGLIVIPAAGDAAAPLIAQFPVADRADTIFIVDPLGNLMERFDARANPKGLREDLTKLLKLSHIG
jgi:hypothetical protein